MFLLHKYYVSKHLWSLALDVTRQESHSQADFLKEDHSAFLLEFSSTSLSLTMYFLFHIIFQSQLARVSVMSYLKAILTSLTWEVLSCKDGDSKDTKCRAPGVLCSIYRNFHVDLHFFLEKFIVSTHLKILYNLWQP